MKHHYQLDPIICLSFTKPEFDVLWKAAQHHYDSTVREMAKSGGCLNGLYNDIYYFNSGEYPIHYTANFRLREIDIMTKALEMSNDPISNKITQYLYDIWMEIIANIQIVNELLTPSN